MARTHPCGLKLQLSHSDKEHELKKVEEDKFNRLLARTIFQKNINTNTMFVTEGTIVSASLVL